MGVIWHRLIELCRRVRSHVTAAWTDLAVLGAVLAGMYALSAWRWPDLLIDFGEELYVPWQMSEGRSLYGDLEYARGPFSAWVNCVAMTLLGVDYESVALVNLTVVVGIALVLRRLVGASATRSSRLLVPAAFITVFAFGQYLAHGNYNYLAPYSHEQAHGILFALLALAFLGAYVHSGSHRWMVGSGLCLAACFMMKVELFLSAAAAVATGLVAFGWSRRTASRTPWSALSLAVAGCAAGLALFAVVAPATANVPPGAVTRAWTEFAKWAPAATADPMAPVLLGLDDPWGNSWAMAVSALSVAGAVAVLLLVNHLLRRAGHLLPWAGRILVPVLTSAVVGGVLLVSVPSRTFLALGRGLPLLVLGSAILLWFKLRREPELAGERAVTLALAVYGLTLLVGRMPLNAHVYHYGFSLAMPGAVLVFHVLLSEMPRVARRLSASARVFQAGAVGMVVAYAAVHVDASAEQYRRKNTWVAGEYRAFDPPFDARTETFKAAVAWVKENLDSSESIAVLPEGVMLNYLSRRRSSVRYSTFNPLLLKALGEEAVISEFAAAPPDYIALVERDNSEHGARYFSVDYARAFGNWIEDRYQLKVVLKTMPFRRQGFGIAILQRR